MSAALKPIVEHFSFDGEIVGQTFDSAAIGAAGAAALRKVKSLADAAPQGRLFAAISTLADNAGKAAAEYEAASLATLRNETEEAEAHLARGTRMVQRLKGTMGAEVATPLPDFMRMR
jgi:thioredoxin-like negative regulator of GroEL